MCSVLQHPVIYGVWVLRCVTDCFLCFPLPKSEPNLIPYPNHGGRCYTFCKCHSLHSAPLLSQCFSNLPASHSHLITPLHSPASTAPAHQPISLVFKPLQHKHSLPGCSSPTCKTLQHFLPAYFHLPFGSPIHCLVSASLLLTPRRLCCFTGLLFWFWTPRPLDHTISKALFVTFACYRTELFWSEGTRPRSRSCFWVRPGSFPYS